MYIHLCNERGLTGYRKDWNDGKKNERWMQLLLYWEVTYEYFLWKGEECACMQIKDKELLINTLLFISFFSTKGLKANYIKLSIRTSSIREGGLSYKHAIYVYYFLLNAII